MIGKLIGAAVGVYVGIITKQEEVFFSIVISSVFFIFLLCFELMCGVKKTFQLLELKYAEYMLEYQFGFWLSILSVGLLRIFV